MSPPSLIRPTGLLCLAIVIGSVFETVAIQATNSSELEALMKEAGRNYQTKDGQQYGEQFLKAIGPAFAAALHACNSKPDTKEPASIVFIVAADGRVKKMLYSEDIPFGECVGSKLRSATTLPPPPRDSYAGALGAANHNNEMISKGPPDNTTGHMKTEKL